MKCLLALTWMIMPASLSIARLTLFYGAAATFNAKYIPKKPGQTLSLTR